MKIYHFNSIDDYSMNYRFRRQIKKAYFSLKDLALISILLSSTFTLALGGVL